MALLEQRNRIASAARGLYTLRLDLGNSIDCAVTIQNKRDEDIDFSKVLAAVNTFTSQVTTAQNFEAVSDGIYNEVAQLYSERDIEVQIINNNSGIAFTKEYNTHKPHQSISI